MSADRRQPMGVQHLTVVPENFEPDVEGEGDAADRNDDSEESA